MWSYSVNQKFRLTGTLALVIFISSCAPRVAYRGKLPDVENVDKIVPGVSRETDVVRLIGSPTLESSYGDREWLYVYKKEQKTSFYDPKLVEKNVLSITFTPEGMVHTVKDLDPEFSEIDPVKYKTKSIGQDRPLLQQIFSNFGRLARKNEEKK